MAILPRNTGFHFFPLGSQNMCGDLLSAPPKVPSSSCLAPSPPHSCALCRHLSRPLITFTSAGETTTRFFRTWRKGKNLDLLIPNHWALEGQSSVKTNKTIKCPRVSEEHWGINGEGIKKSQKGKRRRKKGKEVKTGTVWCEYPRTHL